MVTLTTTSAYDAPAANLEVDNRATQPSLFSSNGRMGVLQYNAYCLIIALIYMSVLVAAFVVWPSAESAMLPLVIPALVMWIILFIKRLHDLNYSAFWLLLSLVPIVGSMFSLYVSLVPGSEDSNRFGSAAESKGWHKYLGICGIVCLLALAAVGTALMVYPDLFE